jgi:predicted membrane protein
MIVMVCGKILTLTHFQRKGFQFLSIQDLFLFFGVFFASSHTTIIRSCQSIITIYSSLLQLFANMTSTADKNCTYLISTEKSTSVQQEDICKDLESAEVAHKIRYAWIVSLK